MQPRANGGGDLVEARSARTGAVRAEAGDRAFDAINPPSPDLIDQCVHCGFCLPSCPTYDLWRVEADSPRGRIVLMDEGLASGSEMGSEMVAHLDACLGCMACVTACPSGVQYDRLIEDTRSQVERNHKRPLRERLVRRLAFATFTYPGRLRLLVPLLVLGRLLGLTRLATRLGKRSPLRALALLAPRVRMRDMRARLRPRWEAAGDPRGTVALLQGCVQRAFFSGVNEASAAVLAAEGFDVEAPDAPRCCGALQLHSGSDEDARRLAKQTIASLEGADHVVANAAGCGSAMKSYGHLLREEPDWAERAASFSERVKDITELLADTPPRATRHPVEATLAYHDPCHLAHAQQVREQPRHLLSDVPGVELVEPEDWTTCCGSAGLYNIFFPETADELGRRKVANLRATGADTVAVANPGCALQIEGHARAEGKPMTTIHPIEILHRSILGSG
jgi:glycolate oxidase iron-sulfur subunit